MEIVISVIAGIMGGILGAVPFFVARSRIKSRLRSDGTGSIVTGLVAVFVSFIVLIIEVAICRLVVADYLLPFSISAIIVFLVSVALYTATLMRR